MGGRAEKTGTPVQRAILRRRVRHRRHDDERRLVQGQVQPRGDLPGDVRHDGRDEEGKEGILTL